MPSSSRAARTESRNSPVSRSKAGSAKVPPEVMPRMLRPGHHLYVGIGCEDRQRSRYLGAHIMVQAKYLRTTMDGKVLILAE